MMEYGCVDVIERLKNSKYDVRNIDFLIRGENQAELEMTAINIANQICSNKMIPFQGREKWFSLFLPYVCTRERADEFINHYENNIGIAKDIYHDYTGIIIIECSLEWVDYGANIEFERIVAKLRENKNVCYIFALKEDAKRKSALFGNMFNGKQCIEIKLESVNKSNLSNLIRWVALDYGLNISEKAVANIEKYVIARKADEKKMITDVISQIALIRTISGECRNTEIQPEETEFLCNNIKEKRRIGFFVD